MGIGLTSSLLFAGPWPSLFQFAVGSLGMFNFLKNVSNMDIHTFRRMWAVSGLGSGLANGEGEENLVLFNSSLT